MYPKVDDSKISYPVVKPYIGRTIPPNILGLCKNYLRILGTFLFQTNSKIIVSIFLKKVLVRKIGRHWNKYNSFGSVNFDRINTSC